VAAENILPFHFFGFPRSLCFGYEQRQYFGNVDNKIFPDYYPVSRQTNQRRKEETMFGKFVKKQMDKSPEEALNDGRKSINSGISGGLTKAFMGQEFVDKMNNAMDQGQAAIDMQKSGNMLAMTGLEASAEVVEIQDTGTLINMNPVVKLTLKVSPPMGMPGFDTSGNSVVSKIAIPRKGDTIKIKYNPANPSEFVVMS
jgi:hypothetical protein